MDWRNYKFWRKNVRRLDETTAEFDVLFKEQSKKLLSEKELEEVFNCSRGHPPILKKVSGRRDKFRNLSDLRKNLFFGKN